MLPDGTHEKLIAKWMRDAVFRAKFNHLEVRCASRKGITNHAD